MMDHGKAVFVSQVDGVHVSSSAGSHAVVANGVVYTAGQIGIGPGGRLLAGFDAQAAQAFDNLEAVLAAAGSELTDVVKVHVCVADPADARKYLMLREKYLPQKPASTLYAVRAFAMPGLLFEIDAIAVPQT
jgi:2-iminobutanoate/2-iminopropanoate deaminase